MEGLVMPPGDRTATAAGSDKFISDCEKLYKTEKNMCIKLGIKLTNTTLHWCFSFYKFKTGEIPYLYNAKIESVIPSPFYLYR